MDFVKISERKFGRARRLISEIDKPTSYRKFEVEIFTKDANMALSAKLILHFSRKIPQGGKMSKREHEWFIESKDAQTDDVLEKNLGGESHIKDVLCFDGKRRNFWGCSFTQVWLLWRNRKNLKIKFEIFGKEGKNGKVRLLTFLFRDEGVKKSIVAKRNYYREHYRRF